MTKKIVLPNGIFRFFWGWFRNQSSNLTTSLPEATRNTVVEEAELSEAPLSDAVISLLIQERLNQWLIGSTATFLGSPDFLPISVLEKGREAGRAVCCLLQQYSDPDIEVIITLANTDPRIAVLASRLFSDETGIADPVRSPDDFRVKARKPVPCATGFLVGENYLLTNQHVIPDQENLGAFSAEFEYETTLNTSNRVAFDADFYKPAQNPQLDYVLLKLESSEITRIKPIPLQTVESVKVAPKPSPGVLPLLLKPSGLLDAEWEKLKSEGLSLDRVNIIQHPEGRPQEVVLFNNLLMELYPDFLAYETDAQPGSSGSPLFNAQWDLIGLHKGAILENDQITAYLGVRMSSILADLREQATTDAEIQDFLISIQPKPALPTTAKQVVFILAGLDRAKILGSDQASLEKAAMLGLQEQIASKLEELNPTIQVERIVGTGKTLVNAIQEINQQSKSFPEARQVAIQLVTDSYRDPKVSGISAYYNGSNPKGKSYADTLLGGIQSKGVEGKIFGAYADQVTSARRLGFCRQTVMPALVFFAGYLSNSDDRARIEALRSGASSSLAEGIAIGLLAWLEKLS